MFDAASTDSEMHDLANVEVGPETKEFNLLRADEEYGNGNVENSIYYQVRALFQCADTRFTTETQELENQTPTISEILKAASAKEKNDYKTNSFFRNIVKHQKKLEQRKAKTKETIEQLDFLEDIRDSLSGFARIVNVCQQLPQEWCVLQLCKSFNAATTYSTFFDISGATGDIYLSLLHHCRSPELGPACLRFDKEKLTDIFKEYSTLVERFRRVVSVDPLTVKAQEAKVKYWKQLYAFGDALQKLIDELISVFSPYSVMFLGKRYHSIAVEQQTKTVFARVDDFCVEHNWSNHQRILLSQAALHANRLASTQVQELSLELSQNEELALLVYELLDNCSNEWDELEQQETLAVKRFPIILIVDERLDHLHWEQLAPMQECTRIKSLHSLWRLYKCHKLQIQHGYYTVNIKRGMSLINPDSDLTNSGRRLRSFFEYWLPHWQNMFDTMPSEQVMTERAFKSDCFVYAGHGSTLQYVSRRLIYRNRIRGVVFLFGCDSTRVLSSGLYSPLYGAQDYYHGALCPTVVGTLMPALDGNMDNVSAHLLSRWIAPANQQVIPWTQIDRAAWVSQGKIQPSTQDNKASSSSSLAAQEDDNQTVEQLGDYQVGSLCSILASIQMGEVEPRIYNCCVYVCRGLPAWNLAVEKLPFPDP